MESWTSEPESRMQSMSRSAVIAAACGGALLTGGGCGPGGEADPTFAVRDSTGVTIVTSERPMWRDDEAWSLSHEPRVEVGVFEGDPAYQFDDVRGVARLSDGRLAVLNGGDAQIRFYDPSGRFQEAVGGLGDGPGEIRRPTGLIRLEDDTLLVSAVADWQASWFTARGEFVRREQLDAARRGEVIDSVWGCPSRPGLLPDATLLLCVGHGVERNRHEGAPRVSHWLVRTPYDVSWVDTVGTFHGLDMSMAFAARGTQVAAGGDPLRIFVGDPGFFEIDVVEDGTGTVRSIRYPNGLRPVGLEDREAYEIYLREWRESRPSGARVEEDRVFPSHMPGFSDLHYDVEGYVWAIEYTTPWEEPSSALVFSADGPLLGRVELPVGFRIGEIGPDYVLGVWRDELDVEFVRLYTLQRG